MNWYELLYVAHRVLGWSRDEFFSATPRMFYNMLEVASEVETPAKKKRKRVRTADDMRNMP